MRVYIEFQNGIYEVIALTLFLMSYV